MATKQPVTMSGWYENTDGTVTKYNWRSGQLCEGATLKSWEAVREVDGDEKVFQDEAAYHASKRA